MQKIIFSGIQPSGNLHIGNYLGAIRNWVAMQNDYSSIFCVVDLHAITVPRDPEELRAKTIEVAKLYLAAGINPERSTIFVQSQIPQHTELMWILNTITKNSDLTKMTQFKAKTGFYEDIFEQAMKEEAEEKFTDKLKKGGISISEEASQGKLANAISSIVLKSSMDVYVKNVKKPFNNIDAGLLNYPILMAADILLHNADTVPVGEDQLQHIELARTLARRFNDRFGETLKVPEPYIKKEGMRIMGLDDPTKKMSKSASSKYNQLGLLDSPDEIREKIKKAVTDSGSSIQYNDEQPAIKNLLNIFSLITNTQPEKIAEKFENAGYGKFKEALAEAIIDFLASFQKKYHETSDADVLMHLQNGKEKLLPLANKKMEEVKKKVGFVME